MISICTVITEKLDPYLDIYLETVSKKLKNVKEVIFCQTDKDAPIEEWENGSIKFKKISCITSYDPHPLGLHKCIDNSSQDYIFLCDPDVFFYSEVDEIYLDLMNRYDIDIIGCSHYSPSRMGFGFFPYIGNLLMKRSSLPDKDFMKGKLKLEDGSCGDEKYLISSPNPECKHYLANQDEMFDAGAYLQIWSKINNLKWLSFQTLDCHLYTTPYNRGSFRLPEKLKKKKLIYHQTSGGSGWPEKVEEFKAAYDESKEKES